MVNRILALHSLQGHESALATKDFKLAITASELDAVLGGSAQASEAITSFGALLFPRLGFGDQTGGILNFKLHHI